MARKKKTHYYVLLCGDQAHVFVTMATAQVECYYLLKEMTGDGEWARSYMNSIDKNFQTPPYPPKGLPSLDVSELEQMINDIALGTI